MRKFLLMMLFLSALTVKADDKAATLTADGIYCGNVNLDVTETADGKYLLYDAKRKIYTIVAAELPSSNELAAQGRLSEFSDMKMSANPTDDELGYWCSKLSQNNKEGLTKYMLSEFKPIDPEETFNPYRLKSIRIEKMTDDEGNSLMPGDMSLIALRTEMLYGHAMACPLFDFIFTGTQTADELCGMQFSGFSQSPIVIDGIAEHDRLIPREGVTLAFTPIFMRNGDFDLSIKKIAFVPDESGESVLETEGLKVTVTYEPYKSSLVDIHWGTARTYDFYHNVFGRESYDGEGSPIYNLTFLPGLSSGIGDILSLNDDDPDDDEDAKEMMSRASDSDDDDLINYVLITYDQAGAFATSSTNPYTIFYGTGGYAKTKFFTRNMCELAVLSHEFTHLVTATTAKLRGYSNEEGAADESFSDIMAISMMKSEYGYGDDYPWTMGAHQVILGKSNLRDFVHPENSLDGDSPYPDTYEGTYWNSQDKYNMASVQTHCYYLMCEGGSGVNDHGFAYSVEGIGLEKARQIAYLTLTKYAHQDYTFAESRKCFLAAAKELYGESSAEVKTVADAWDAVGVYDESSGIGNIQMDRPSAQYLYDLQGRRVNHPHPGVYIRNGKKVVIKD